MLNKLLKYDLKYMIKNMAIFYILSIFFAITTRILFYMEQSVIINIIGQISVGCMFAMIVNTLINTMMRSWVRFRDSLYKDESYLTHTLPVTKNNLYNSKFIQTLIFFFISFIVAFITVLDIIILEMSSSCITILEARGIRITSNNRRKINGRNTLAKLSVAVSQSKTIIAHL